LIRGRLAPGAMMGAMDADRARELLAAERKRLEQALVGRGHTDVGELSDQDEPADQATELYQDEFDEGLAEDIREQLAAVARAEARLEAGTYGLSVLSGEPIPDERLEAVPTAELTVAEEQRRGRPA
jgi:DnaK suppressor protein